MRAWGWTIGLALVACHGRSAPAPDAGEPTPSAGQGAPSAAASPEGADREHGNDLLLDPLPPYDLAADIQKRTDAVRRELGAVPPPRVESDVFLFFQADHGAAFEATVQLAHDALAPMFDGRFATRPTHAVTVLVYGSRDRFLEACKARRRKVDPTDLGEYVAATREILLTTASGRSTVTHEIVHPITEVDFPDAPAWLDEGLASLFETPVLAPAGQIHGDRTNWRLAGLRAALAKPGGRDRVRIDTLFGMDDGVFRGEGKELHYAEARFLCQWLDDRGLLWRFYAEWRGSFDQDPGGARAFTKVTGEAPEQANERWVTWVQGLALPPVGARSLAQ